MSDEPDASADPLSENEKITDLSALRALQDQAGELLDEKGVFMRSVRAVRISWFRELMATRDKDIEDKLLAQLRALTALPQVLRTAISDHTMAKRRHG